MTPEQLRKIDVLVAEKILGYRKIDRMEHLFGTYVHLTWRADETSTAYTDAQLPHFTSDIQAAWEVVEKLGNKVTIYGPEARYASGEYRNGDTWDCEITGDFQSEWSDDPEDRTDYVRCEGATAPLAICLAALKAVGVTLEHRGDGDAD